MANLAFIGGTGDEGLGLAMRFAKSGNQIFIGSRILERAQEAAAKVKEKVPQAKVQGLLNEEAAAKGEIVFLTVPYDAHRDALEALAEVIADKVLVDTVVPLVFDRDGPKAIAVEEGSAALQARAVARRAKVVSAFHHLDATDLQKVQRPMQGDVIVCSDHKGAKKRILELAEEIEYVRALDGGGLANSRYLEQWTVMLLHLNRIHKGHSGIRIVGI